MFKLLKVLYDCGAISEKDMEKLGIDYNIASELLRNEQVLAKTINGNLVYTVTEFGEKVYRIEKNEKHFIRCLNVNKCIALADFYSNLTENERETWKNKDILYFEGAEGAIPDATYEKDGKLYGVYVQTKNTNKDIITSIEKYAKNNKLENISYIKEIINK